MTPFCSKEYEESIGTVRSLLAPSNVEIIDSIYFFKNGQFLTKKVIFLENDWSDRARNWRADARNDSGKMNFEGERSIKYSFSKENSGCPFLKEDWWNKTQND